MSGITEEVMRVLTHHSSEDAPLSAAEVRDLIATTGLTRTIVPSTLCHLTNRGFIVRVDSSVPGGVTKFYVDDPEVWASRTHQRGRQNDEAEVEKFDPAAAKSVANVGLAWAHKGIMCPTVGWPGDSAAYARAS